MMKFMMMEMLEKIILMLIMMLMGMISVSFLTLFERKLLGYIQIRKGPNKILFMGLFQPFSDAIKLLTKEIFKLEKINLSFYYLCPLMMLIMSLMVWLILDKLNFLSSMSLGILFMLSSLSISGYFVMISGWSSNSMYSMLGAIRSVAQLISYEVSMIFLIMIMMIMIEGFSLSDLMKFQSLNFVLYLYPVSYIFFVTVVAELNRTPFDLIEGESELVSGFNVEYFSGGFTLIFLSEYMNILFMSMMFSSMFMSMNSLMMYLLMSMFVIYLILVIRGVLPRMRYDELMKVCWLEILPFSINYLFYVSMVKFFMMS